jgi:hypothetical protein
MNHRFDNFNQLVDAALNTERKHREIEDKKRKMTPAASGSNTRPRYQYPQQQQQQCGRTNLNYTGSSTRVLSGGLPRASNGIILLVCWVTSR